MWIATFRLLNFGSRHLSRRSTNYAFPFEAYYRSSMGLAHIVQFTIETLRMTSEVTTSRKKRCYLNMNNHNIFYDFNLAQPFLYSVQSESLVALEAAKAAEKSVLDEQVRSSQETLQEKLKELSALQQQNVKVE